MGASSAAVSCLKRMMGAADSPGGDGTAGLPKIAELTKNTLVYGVGVIINRFLGLLLLPVFTSYLSPSDYGVAAIAGVLTLVLAGLFTLGTGQSMGLCYFARPPGQARMRIVWTTAALLSANATILTAVGIWLSDPISSLLLATPRYGYVFALALAGLAAQSVADPFWSYFRLERQAATFVRLSIAATVAILALSAYLIVVAGRGLVGLFEATLMVRLAVLPVLALTVSRRAPPGFDWSSIAPLVRIGLPSTFALAAFFVIDYVDRQMLQIMVGTDEVGIYAVGYTFGMVMAAAVDSFGNAWPPLFMSFVGRQAEAARLFPMVLRYYVMVFGALCLAFFALAQPLLAFATAPPFHGAYSVVGLVALAYLLKGVYLILLPPLYFARKLIVQSGIEWFAALVTVGLNLVLIPLYRKDGAAIATAVAYLSLPVLAYVIGSRYLRIHYDWRRVGVIAAGLAVTAAAVTVVQPVLPLLLQFGIGCLFTALFAAFAARMGTTTEERRSMIRQLRTVRARPGGRAHRLE